MRIRAEADHDVVVVLACRDVTAAEPAADKLRQGGGQIEGQLGRVWLHLIRPPSTQRFIERHQVLLFGELQGDKVDLGREQ